MSDPLILTLGDLGQLFDGPHATPTRIAEGPYFLNISSLNAGRLDLSQSDHVSREDFGKWTKRVTPEEGDLLFSYETRLGEAALMPAGIEACLGRRMALLRPDRGIINPQFLLYYYLSPSFQRLIEQHTIHGATVNRISLSTMGSWPVSVPPIKDQQAIAEVLGALDDKIAANTKFAATAETLILSAFKKLLMTTEVRQVVVQEITSRLQITRKFLKSEILVDGDFPVFDQSDAGHLGYLNGEGYLDASPEHPVLYFGDHTCKLRLSAERFFVGPNTIPFVGREIPTLAFFASLQGVQKHEEYKRHWGSLMSKSVTIPSLQSCIDFERRFAHCLPFIAGLRSENKRLAATRDTLLPQLMSGKLRINGSIMPSASAAEKLGQQR